MTEELRLRFNLYLRVLEDTFNDDRSSEFYFESMVDQVEGTPECSDLCAQFEKDHADGKAVMSGYTRNLLSSFCRGSGLYRSLLQSEKLDYSKWSMLLDSEIQKRDETITYVAPMEFFHCDADEIPCGDASIRTLSDDDLRVVLHNENNRQVYPFAYIDLADLNGYHFLVAKEVRHRKVWNALDFGAVFNGTVAPSYSGFPKAVERALQLITLWHWSGFDPYADEYMEWAGPELPHVPFVLTRSNSLFYRPTPSPDLRMLAKEGVLDNYGEEVGQRPIHYMGSGTDGEQLSRFFVGCRESIGKVKKQRAAWKPLEAGLNFLVKGFSTVGIEQLLWHMTAIDAVLGGVGVSTNQLGNRLGRQR